MAFALGCLALTSLALAGESAKDQIKKELVAREGMVNKAKATAEGFTSHNHKYEVIAGSLMEQANNVSLKNNRNHIALEKVLAETRKIEAEIAAAEAADKLADEKKISTPKAGVIAIGPTTDAPVLEQRCRAINAKIRETSLAKTKTKLDERQLANTAKFTVEGDDSSGGSRSPASAPKNAGASRMAKKGE